MRLFDVLGPVMIGPSSSHTAGAAKIGATASTLLGEAPVCAEILLHGSFATTGKGHGTDRAIVAGLLGMQPDDARLPNSFDVAKKQGLAFTIKAVELRDAHPNTAQITLTGKSGKSRTVRAASIGGGRICVSELDGMKASFGGENNTLVIHNDDTPGTIAAVTSQLALRNINIASMQVFRTGKGEQAVMVLECDQPLRANLSAALRMQPGILSVARLNVIPGK